MEFSEYFSIWNKLDVADREELNAAAFKKMIPSGTVIHNGSMDCMGLLLVRSGQLRAYITSEEGKEVTIYRLFDRDICLFSASCMMRSIQFDITIIAEKDTDVWVIPIDVYKGVMERSAVLANYTSEIMGTRFTDVMWLIEQVMWKSMDKRVATFILEESAIEQTELLHITHDRIASHLGTAREVVTRLLKYLQSEGAIRLNRATIEITDSKKLLRLSD